MPDLMLYSACLIESPLTSVGDAVQMHVKSHGFVMSCLTVAQVCCSGVTYSVF